VPLTEAAGVQPGWSVLRSVMQKFVAVRILRAHPENGAGWSPTFHAKTEKGIKNCECWNVTPGTHCWQELVVETILQYFLATVVLSFGRLVMVPSKKRTCHVMAGWQGIANLKFDRSCHSWDCRLTSFFGTCLQLHFRLRVRLYFTYQWTTVM
jgi:hypothetical protein